MSETKRNIAVGVTVLVALAGMAFMVVLFGQLGTFVSTGYKVKIVFGQISGLAAGSAVNLNGNKIGKVETIALVDERYPAKGWMLTCRIDSDARIPRDVSTYIVSRGIVGSSSVELNTAPFDPAKPPAAFWPTDGSARWAGNYRGSSLLPEEFVTLGKNLNRLVETLTGDGEGPTTAPDQGLAGTLARMNRALDAFTAIAGYPDNQDNIRESLKNLRIASESGVEAMRELRGLATRARGTFDKADAAIDEFKQLGESAKKRLDDVAGSIIDDADQLSKLLTTLNKVAVQATEGKGTLAKLLSDPTFYNNLVESSDQLGKSIRTLREILDDWKAQGIKIRVK